MTYPILTQPSFSMPGSPGPGTSQPWTYLLKSQGGAKQEPIMGRSPRDAAAPSPSYLVEAFPDYRIEDKVYGDSMAIANRILTTYEDRKASTGVLLVGSAGSGKTLMMKILSQLSRERLKIPTVVVNEPFIGDAFNSFVQSLPPCVMIFDEFEKVYRYNSQESLLTLYDGLFSSHKLLVHTANDINGINGHYLNRPGRIYYCIKYKGLSAAFVREYCEEKLNNVCYIPDLIQIVSLHKSFSFDMLKALVEEMNRYGEPPRKALKILNVAPGSDMEYRVVVILPPSRRLPQRDVYPSVLEGNPMMKGSIRISWADRGGLQSSTAGVAEFTPSPENIKLDATGRTYSHTTEDGTVILFERLDEVIIDDPLEALGIK